MNETAHWVNSFADVNSCCVLEGLVERSRDELEEVWWDAVRVYS